MMRTLLISTASALLVAGGALAQDWHAEEWDADADAYIDAEEFRAGATEADLFAMYDLNNDGVIEEAELYDVTFAQYDRDQDERWASEDVEDFMSSVRGAGDVSQ